MNTPYDVTIKALPESMVEISGTVTWDALAAFEQKAFSRLSTHIEVAGFRKGHVPEDIARKQVPDDLLLADMAELAVQEFYPKIIVEHKVDVIGRPEVSINKIARGNELGFTIKAAVVPDIKLPNYKKLASGVTKETAADISEEETDKVIKDLQQLRAYGHVHGEHDEHKHEEPLPEVNEEFIKSFGDFADMAAFRAKIRENVSREKEQDVKDKRRIGIMEAIIAETTFDVPNVVLRSEQEKMIAQIETDIAHAGMTMDDYLKQVDKTKDDLLSEFKPEAEKRARFQLVIHAIARAEDVKVTDEEVTEEAKRLVASYPGADLERAKAYADMVITNDRVLSMLESQ